MVSFAFQNSVLSSYFLVLTFAQLHQTGAVCFPLPSARLCKAVFGGTSFSAGGRMGQSEHLPAPRHPTLRHLTTPENNSSELH